MMVQDSPEAPVRRAASRLPVFALGVALAGAFALAFAFAMTKPPPPQTAWMVAEIRLAGGGSPHVTAASGGETREPDQMSTRQDGAGRDIVQVAFAISRQSPIGSLHVYRSGLPDIRFSLNLPSDPPSTGDFTHWLSADGSSQGGPSAELRFRIDRRAGR